MVNLIQIGKPFFGSLTSETETSDRYSGFTAATNNSHGSGDTVLIKQETMPVTGIQGELRGTRL